MNREAIYSALFTLASGATLFKTKSRKIKAWTEIPPESQPALFQVQSSETADQKEGAPTRWIIHVDLVVYASSGEGVEIPSSALNPIIDNIVNLFEPNPASGRQTLGGLVRYAKVNGEIQIDEALLGGQAVAVIPIEILSERDWSVAPT